MMQERVARFGRVCCSSVGKFDGNSRLETGLARMERGVLESER